MEVTPEEPQNQTKLATPRGFAQYETSGQVLEIATNEAWRARFDLVQLTA
jgi:hypothetical protein